MYNIATNQLNFLLLCQAVCCNSDFHFGVASNVGSLFLAFSILSIMCLHRCVSFIFIPWVFAEFLGFVVWILEPYLFKYFLCFLLFLFSSGTLFFDMLNITLELLYTLFYFLLLFFPLLALFLLTYFHF